MAAAVDKLNSVLDTAEEQTREHGDSAMGLTRPETERQRQERKGLGRTIAGT